MSWTLNDLIEKARRENISMSELGRRGGNKAARLRRKKKQQRQQLMLAL